MKQFTAPINTPLRLVLRRIEHVHPLEVGKEASGLSTAFLSFVSEGFEEHGELPIGDLRQFPKDMTVKYLMQTHRYYLNTLIPEIELHFLEVTRSAGIYSLDLLEIYSAFTSYCSALEKHIQFEEEKLFPLILAAGSNGKCLHHSILNAAHHQHEDELSIILDKIRQRAEVYGVHMPFRMLVEKLDNLNKDLQVHARIEDEVLLA